MLHKYAYIYINNYIYIVCRTWYVRSLKVSDLSGKPLLSETCLCFQHCTRHQPRTDLQPKFCAFNFSKLCRTRLLTTWSVIPTCFESMILFIPAKWQYQGMRVRNRTFNHIAVSSDLIWLQKSGKYSPGHVPPWILKNYLKMEPIDGPEKL